METNEDHGPASRGMQFVLASLASARKRIALIKIESKFRDTDEIWETYCDIEQSIEVSKYVFKLQNRLGKYRKLKVSSQNDPATLALTKLCAIYDEVDSLVISACEAAKQGKGEDAIELSRRARDQLKILLLGQAKSERKKMSQERSSSN